MNIVKIITEKKDKVKNIEERNVNDEYNVYICRCCRVGESVLGCCFGLEHQSAPCG